MFKAFIAAESPGHQLRNIIVLPKEVDKSHSCNYKLRDVVALMGQKLEEYHQVLSHSSPAEFAVNYVQNRFICSEFWEIIAGLWTTFNISKYKDLACALDKVKLTDPEAVATLDKHIIELNTLLAEIDFKLDVQLGTKCQPQSYADPIGPEELPGLRNQTVCQLINASPYDIVLVVVVNSFSSADVNQHIVELYNRVGEFHRSNCEVFLLTRGPPIGSRGGGYIKLIGVPFRKMVDEAEAIAELRLHRRSAVRMAGWEAICQTVEAALADDEDDRDNIFARRGGVLLIDRKGAIIFKHIESEDTPWPSVECLFQQTNTVNKPQTRPPTSKSEHTSHERMDIRGKTKTCCTIS